MDSDQTLGCTNENFTNDEMDATNGLNLNMNIMETSQSPGKLEINLFDTCKLHHPSQEPKLPAVIVRNGFKSFKSRKGVTAVLNDFSMTVEQGSIYSLLGSSGCGKTTLLSCCVGIKSLDEGKIRIFGSKPGTRKCGVPGRNVGYMPQEIALYPELTIGEILRFYGRMFGLNWNTIQESVEFLIGFLALPPAHRRISSLSGGQLRRVSLGVALVHSPRLLILDEPTVGMDPLLRQTIWNHLVNLVSSGQTTVIITTHYIEEARQSNQIGLMRGGRLLTEDSPENLLRIHKTNLLEDIVLKLCLQDNNDGDRESTHSSSTSSTSSCNDSPSTIVISTNNSPEKHSQKQSSGLSSNQIIPLYADDVVVTHQDVSDINYGLVANVKLRGVNKRANSRLSVDFPNSKKNNNNILDFQKRSEAIRKESSAIAERETGRIQESWERIQAMTIKNALSLLRNIPFLLFIFFMPAFQVIIVCIAIGQDPKGLKFGLVNHDAVDPQNCPVTQGCVAYDNYTGSISCQFLDILNKHGTLNTIIYDNEEEALKDVERSHTWGYLMFNKNYTTSMKDRAIFGMLSEPESIYGSRIKFKVDQSNLQIFRETTKVFLESFAEFMRSISVDCNIDPINAELPIYFDQPVFGADSINFTDFLAPSVLLAILFFFPLSGSGIAYITEKKMGTLSRNLVAGVTSFEIMIAHLIVQVILLLIQVALSFAILSLVFKIQIAGPFHCAYILAVLVGIAGMSMGFLMATFCNEEIEAVLIALGTFLPNMLLSGLLWPLEGLPIYLKYFSYLLPCTWAGEAMRSVLIRGVSYEHPTVWPGFLSVAIWIVIYWALNILLHKRTSKK